MFPNHNYTLDIQIYYPIAPTESNYNNFTIDNESISKIIIGTNAPYSSTNTKYISLKRPKLYDATYATLILQRNSVIISTPDHTLIELKDWETRFPSSLELNLLGKREAEYYLSGLTTNEKRPTLKIKINEIKN